jgi:nitroreductase
MIKDLVLRNRSYRRFDQEIAIEMATLRELVDLARLSASAANMQPLRYILSCEPERNALIHSHLAWAAYLKDWPGPGEGERPSAYIVILEDSEVGHPLGVDHGIAAQSILLGAVERGLGGCIIGSVDKQGLCGTLQIADRYKVLVVLALGKPKETVAVEALDSSGDVKYWHDANGVHHVPKRSLDDIIIG